MSPITPPQFCSKFMPQLSQFSPPCPFNPLFSSFKFPVNDRFLLHSRRISTGLASTARNIFIITRKLVDEFKVVCIDQVRQFLLSRWYLRIVYPQSRLTLCKYICSSWYTNNRRHQSKLISGDILVDATGL